RRGTSATRKRPAIGIGPRSSLWRGAIVGSRARAQKEREANQETGLANHGGLVHLAHFSSLSNRLAASREQSACGDPDSPMTKQTAGCFVQEGSPEPFDRYRWQG